MSTELARCNIITAMSTEVARRNIIAAMSTELARRTAYHNDEHREGRDDLGVVPEARLHVLVSVQHWVVEVELPLGFLVLAAPHTVSDALLKFQPRWLLQ